MEKENVSYSSDYKKLLDYMYDLIMEYDCRDNTFIYNQDKYHYIFHKNADFTSMDQCFWDMCDHFVVEEDLEKMDMFRSVDIQKRLRNKDYVIKTEIRIKREHDKILWLRLIFVCLPNELNTSIDKVFILFKDCSVEMAEKMTNIMYARVDALTQIWNRRYSEELIGKRIKSNGNGLFVIFDIDNFKNVNDIYGHMTGDELLRKISHIVSERAVEDDVFGRLGGDEFVLYLSGPYADSMNRFTMIMENMKFDYYENETKLKIHCSAGVAVITNSDLTFYDLYEAADKALYDAKKMGKNTYTVHMMEQ